MHIKLLCISEVTSEKKTHIFFQIVVERARLWGHVRMATQQEGSFCVVSMWDHDKQTFGRALDSNKKQKGE
jgi:hypothetical protein